MKSIEELPIEGRRVFVRVDFNVPVKDGRVSDATRIQAALPTIRHAIERGAKLVLASHLGRPGGEVKAKYSLGPVASVLAEALGRPVALLPDCVGPQVEAAVAGMRPGDVALLENLRFHAEEEANDPGFAAALAKLADVYVNDAFGTAHRAHASTAGIVACVGEAGAGFLLQEEARVLGGLLADPARPFVAVVGGAKVSDKIPLLRSLLEKVDAILIGGAMAYTFLLARGVDVGASRVEDDRVSTAKELLARAGERGVEIALPVDHVVAREFAEGASARTTPGEAIDAGEMGLDIGPATRRRFESLIAGAKTVLWNGPMGVFEWESFAAGTMAVANAIADSGAQSIVGGGDSVAALAKSGRSADVTHISTGGGASLEFLEGRELPGIAALEHKGRSAS